jgi:hypothetical protein
VKRWLAFVAAPLAALLPASTAAAQEAPGAVEEPCANPPCAAVPHEHRQPKTEKLTARLAGLLDAGITYQRIYTIPIVAADFGGAVGLETQWFAVYFDASMLWGSTQDGLTTRNVRFGPMAEGKIDRFRIGAGVEFDIMWFDRVTYTGAITGLGWGGYLFASVDLVKLDPESVYLSVRLNGDVFAGDANQLAGLWGPSALVGFRF